MPTHRRETRGHQIAMAKRSPNKIAEHSSRTNLQRPRYHPRNQILVLAFAGRVPMAVEAVTVVSKAVSPLSSPDYRRRRRFFRLSWRLISLCFVDDCAAAFAAARSQALMAAQTMMALVHSRSCLIAVARPRGRRPAPPSRPSRASTRRRREHFWPTYYNHKTTSTPPATCSPDASVNASASSLSSVVCPLSPVNITQTHPERFTPPRRPPHQTRP